MLTPKSKERALNREYETHKYIYVCIRAHVHVTRVYVPVFWTRTKHLTLFKRLLFKTKCNGHLFF